MINPLDIDTLIFVHDQDIILSYENNKKFACFEDYKYIFLGMNDISKLSNIKNIIYARDLDSNMESYPKMCVYSGWYALFKNNLITKKFTNFFEYDISIVPDFALKQSELISDDDIYGYLPMKIDSGFIGNPSWSGKLNEFYDNLQYTISEKQLANSIDTWSSTSNITMKKEFFYKYMNDSEALFDWIKGYDSVGHELERNLSVYYILNDNVKVSFLTGMISHYQLDSHKTQGIITKNYKTIIKRLSTNKNKQ